MANESKCRITYVEPTEINDKKDNGYVSDLEDYSIYVELSIMKNDRYSCGQMSNEEIKYVSNNGTLNFMNGTSGVLTTNFTDIKMTEMDENTKECLGIKSINIDFNSWTCPHVNIVFNDVRGASLVGRNDSFLNGTSKTPSFFNEMFKFPYPLFKLTIKGFYGKSVTYMLALENTLLPFDAYSGNFEISANFVGYLFGAFTDIPLQLVSIAPYVSYNGENYWDLQVNNGTFTFDDGSPMMKYPELQLKIAQVSASEDYKRITSVQDKYINNLYEQKKLLEDILEAYPFKDGWYEPEGDEILFNITDGNISKEINNNNKSFIEKIKNYDRIYATSYFSIFNFLNENVETIIVSYDKKEKKYTYKPFKHSDVAENKNVLIQRVKMEAAKVKKYRINFFKKGSNYYIDNGKIIKEEINKIDIEINRIKNEYAKSNELLVSKAIGFKPTIANFYNLLFAHIDTFAHLVYSALSNIKSQLDDNSEFRNPVYYQTLIGLTDINNEKGRGQLPPFTGFYSESTNENSKRELIYPEALSNSENMEEVKLVDAFVEAAKVYIKKEKSLYNILSGNALTDMSTFIPLTNYDVIKYSEMPNNPYACVGNFTNGMDYSFAVALILGTRIFYYLNGNSENNSEGNSFGTLDALNFFKAISALPNSMTKDFFDSFVSNPSNGTEKIISLLFENNASNFLQKSPFFKKENNVYYNWFSLNNNAYLPIGIDDILQLKDDIVRKKIHNVKFINLDNVLSGNTDNFRVIDDKNFISNIYNEISNGDFGENSKIKLYKEKKVLRNLSNNLKDNYSLPPYDLEAFKYSEYNEEDNEKIVERNTNKADIENVLATNSYENIFIQNPTYVDSSSLYSLYGNPLYWLQDNNPNEEERILAKSYLFLLGIPITSNNKNIGIPTKVENTSVLKSFLLREGALYWRESNILKNGSKELDGFVHSGLTPEYIFEKKNDKRNFAYKVPEANQAYACSNGIRTVKGYLISENNNYAEFKEPKGNTLDRKDKLIKFFKEWTYSEFYKIDNLLRDIDVYQNANEIKIKNGRIKNLKLDYANGRQVGITLKNKKCSEIQIALKELFFDSCCVIDTTNNIDGDKCVPLSSFKSAIKSFMKQLKELKYSKNNGDTSISNGVIGSDFKLALYLALKNLYDKWFCCNGEQKWKFNKYYPYSSKSIFSKFLYLDAFYHDIGNKLNLNVTTISSLLSQYLPSSNEVSFDNGINVYKFLASMANAGQGQLLTIPFLNESGDKKDDIEEVFKVHPLPKYTSDEDDFSFIFLYSYKLSEHLSEKNGYKYDGMDLNDESTCSSIMDENGFIIPAFGVTFAKQNQSFFSNIKLNTNSPQVNEAGIMASINIASKASEGPRETNLYGQDIYKIYASNSYECTVEMMGDAQIFPLMYFQLNNIPLWKGVYMIISVSHEIVAGNMKTIFKGVKISRNSLPMVEMETMVYKNTDVDIIDNKMLNKSGNLISGGTDDIAAYNTWNYIFNVLNLEDKGKCAKYVYQMACSFVGKDGVEFGDGKNSTRAGGNANQESYWDNLKKLGYSIVLDKVFDIPSSDMDSEIKKIDTKVGDILVYYATNAENKKDSAYVYGHTQFYVGGEIGWASSTKNNYIGPPGTFVYRNKKGCSKWRVLHFKSPSSGSYKN